MLGIAATATNPPATAAAPPLAMVSASSGARSPEVHMNVEETRGHDESRGIELRNVRCIRRTDRTNLAAPNGNIRRDVDFAFRIDDPAVFHQQIHQPPSNRNSTAMRTATPDDT